MFLQEHRAGVLGISDFTLLKGEPITVAGEVLEHRLFHFRLPYSGWCHVAVIHDGESFVALSEALQNALALCGGVPAEHRTDSLSACFRNRDGSYAKDFTRGTPIVLRQSSWRRTIGDPQPVPRVKRHPLLALWRHENWSTWRLADGAFLGALGSVFHRCLSCRCGLGRHPVPPLLGFPSGLLTGRRWPQASAVR
jgi:hypothetical protein